MAEGWEYGGPSTDCFTEVGLCMCGYVTMQINKLGQKSIAAFFMGMTAMDEDAEMANKPTSLKSGHPTCTVSL